MNSNVGNLGQRLSYSETGTKINLGRASEQHQLASARAPTCPQVWNDPEWSRQRLPVRTGRRSPFEFPSRACHRTAVSSSDWGGAEWSEPLIVFRWMGAYGGFQMRTFFFMGRNEINKSRVSWKIWKIERRAAIVTTWWGPTTLLRRKPIPKYLRSLRRDLHTRDEAERFERGRIASKVRKGYQLNPRKRRVG